MRAIVLGVGAMGAATCWRLAQRGVDVLGLEQFAVPHTLGSSHGESRLTRMAYFEHPDYVPLLRQAFAGWDELGGLLQRTGLALAGPPESAILQGTLHSARLHDLAVDVCLARNCPQLHAFALPSDWHAVVEPGAGWLPVERCVAALADAARQHGATIHEHERVLDWQPDSDGVQVRTDKATYRADRLVLAQGAWSGPLLRDLGIGFAVHRNLLFWLEASPQHTAPCFGLDTPQGFVYGFPRRDGRVKLALHDPGEPLAEPLAVDRELRPDDAATILQIAQEVAPHLGRRVVQHAVCLYEMSPDAHFILDVHPQWPQVAIAAGFSGHGFKFAPVIGQVLADLAQTGTTRLPAQFLGLQRFTQV